MNKKTIVIIAIAAAFVLGLLITFVINKGEMPKDGNIAMKENIVSAEKIGEYAGYRKMIIRYPEDSAEKAGNLSSIYKYERFLNGGLTAEREEQQVLADELFWGNDIEYCFLDIDGDGCEELQIRDGTVFYTVKEQEGALRIIFEGWWSYEPVLADGRCGILNYSDGYGSERIEFRKMSADGSTESEGSLSWYDKNRNGTLDGGDSFYGDGEAGMEQYLNAREEYIAMRSENELEWTGRRLKNFAAWQDAYIDFIRKIRVTWWVPEEGFRYSLLFVDADDVPELYVDTGFAAGGEFIVSFCDDDGKVGCMNRERGGLQYIERSGLLYSGYGATGFYPCNVYMLDKGEFSEIGTGWYSESSDEQGELCYDFFWEESPVTEAAYEASVQELIDTSKCAGPSVLYTEEEILDILAE